MNIKQRAEQFLTLCAAGKARDAFKQFAANNFLHHNAYYAPDAESLIKGMEENAQQFPQKTCEIQRAISEGNMVVLHSRVRLNPQHAGIAVVHIFRFDAGKIAELWDIGQAVPDNIVNQRGMF